jgi:hypothetical protein
MWSITKKRADRGWKGTTETKRVLVHNESDRTNRKERNGRKEEKGESE